VAFTADQLAAYLLTQSNLKTVIERGDQTEEEMRAWIIDETASLFADKADPVFLFGGLVACHRQSPKGFVAISAAHRCTMPLLPARLGRSRQQP